MQTKPVGIKGVARELGWVPWGWGSGHQGAAPDLPLEHLRARTGLELPLEQNGRLMAGVHCPHEWTAGPVTGMGISEGLGRPGEAR